MKELKKVTCAAKDFANISEMPDCMRELKNTKIETTSQYGLRKYDVGPNDVGIERIEFETPHKIQIVCSQILDDDGIVWSPIRALDPTETDAKYDVFNAMKHEDIFELMKQYLVENNYEISDEVPQVCVSRHNEDASKNLYVARSYSLIVTGQYK